MTFEHKERYMGMPYTPEQRERMIEESKGKVIDTMEWVSEDEYWVIKFTDGTEMCVRFMAELSLWG